MRTVASWLALLLIFVIPWENSVVLDSVGTISRTIGLLTALAWGIAVARTREVRTPHLFHILLALLVCWSAVSGLWTVDVEATMDRTATLFQLAALVFILWDLQRTQTALELGLQAYVLGAWVSFGSVIANYGAAVDPVGQRFTATGFNPNSVALVLALGLPVAWYLAVFGGKRTRVLTLVNYAYVPAGCVAILLTASRAGLVASVAAGLFMLATLTRVGLVGRLVGVTGFVGLMVAAQAVVPGSSFERLGTTATAALESAPSDAKIGVLPGSDGRYDIWREGLTIFTEHPFLGVGSAAFKTAAVDTESSAHNGYLAMLVELGVLGLILFVAVQVVSIRSALGQPRQLLGLWLAVLITLGTALMTHNWEERKQTWLFLNLVVVSASVPSGDPARSRVPAASRRKRWRPLSATVRQQRRLGVERRRTRLAHGHIPQQSTGTPSRGRGVS